MKKTITLATLFIFICNSFCSADTNVRPIKLEYIKSIAEHNKRALAEDPGYISYKFPHPNQITLDPVLLGKCLALTVHTQFPQFSIQKKGNGKNLKGFLPYLGANLNREIDLETGKEEDLRLWIMGQSDNSIDPISLFQASMHINASNIWEAILTIHQLLRNEARWWDTYRYQYASDSLRAHHFFNKFIDIRGDLSELGEGHYGDHRGTWYRIWGVVLGKMMNTKDLDIDLLSIDQNNSNIKIFSPAQSVVEPIRDWIANLIISKERRKSKRVEHDSKKGKINSQALKMSSVFLSELEKSDHKVTVEECSDRIYLIGW